jgi:hypothetical protein
MITHLIVFVEIQHAEGPESGAMNGLSKQRHRCSVSRIDKGVPHHELAKRLPLDPRCG